MNTHRLLPLGAAALLAVAGHSLPLGTPRPPEHRTRLQLSIPPQSLATQACLATRIVHGIVAGLDTAVIDGGGVVTDLEVNVLDCIKGSAAQGVKIRCAGGRHGDHQVDVPSAPRLQRGDEVVLFLTNSGQGETDGILGLQQGTLHVQRQGEAPTVHGPLAPAGETLTTFLDRVRSTLSAPPAVLAAPQQEGK